MKRLISVLLAAVLVLGSTAAAFAAGSSGEETAALTEKTEEKTSSVARSYRTSVLQGTVDESLNPYDDYGLRIRYSLPNYIGTVMAQLQTTEGTAQSDVMVIYVPNDKWDGSCYYSGLTASVTNTRGYYFYSGAETIIAWKDLYSYGFIPISGGVYVYDTDTVQMNFLSGPGVYTAYATVPFSVQDTGTEDYTKAIASDPDSVLMTAVGFPFVLILNDDMADYFLTNGVLEANSSYTWPGLADLLASAQFEKTADSGNFGLQNFTEKETYYTGKLYDLIGDSSWYVPYVEKVYQLGLMGGYSDGCFRSGSEVTLAEVITIAAKIRDIYCGGTGSFTSGSVWYSSYVAYAIRNGIIAEGDFTDYTRKATRGEIAYIFSGTLPESEYGKRVSSRFIRDISEKTPYYSSIVKLYEAGILSGYVNGTFGPSRSVSRAELAAIIVKLLDPSQRSVK